MALPLRVKLYPLAKRIATLDVLVVIKSFLHKGLEAFFTTGKKSGIRPDHANKLHRQLAVLDNAQSINDIPGSWKPHALSGTAAAGRDVRGHHAIWVSGNWRVVFTFEGTDV